MKNGKRTLLISMCVDVSSIKVPTSRQLERKRKERGINSWQHHQNYQGTKNELLMKRTGNIKINQYGKPVEQLSKWSNLSA